MDLYTIEPIVEPSDPDVEWLLREIRAALQTVEALVRDRKTPPPVIELGE